MPQLRPSWHLSFEVAAILLVLFAIGTVIGCRRPRPGLALATAFVREFAVIVTLLGVWQLVGAAVRTRVDGAMERGREIHTWEAALHLPSERWLQAVADGVPGLMRFANVFYAYVHLNSMAFFLMWLWWRHRDGYSRARGVIIVSTFACLVVQSVPVAPPRLLPDLGFVDTALRDGASVYGPFGSGMANQLAAMPSVHVGWAVIVGWYVWWYAPRRWGWIGPLHTVLTVLVVVVTANHWWFDGLVAAWFVVMSMAAPTAWQAARQLIHNDPRPVAHVLLRDAR